MPETNGGEEEAEAVEAEGAVEGREPDEVTDSMAVADGEESVPAMQLAASLRKNGDEAGLYLRPKKLGKLLNRLEEQGFDGYLVYGKGEEPKMFRKD